MISRKPCGLCGATDWTEAHFALGRIVCPTCWAGQQPAPAMPPTARERQLILDWTAPTAPPRKPGHVVVREAPGTFR